MSQHQFRRDDRSPEPEAGRAELRRAAFLKAARDVFLEYGYEAANMAEIVKRAGGSLSTLYAQFGGKKGLFEAMIDARVNELTEQMQIELAAHAPLREGLRRIGEAFLFRQTRAGIPGRVPAHGGAGEEISRAGRNLGQARAGGACAGRWPSTCVDRAQGRRDPDRQRRSGRGRVLRPGARADTIPRAARCRPTSRPTAKSARRSSAP